MSGKDSDVPQGLSRIAPSLDRQMRTRVSLKPGRRGTKKLLAQYGDRLVRVRHRHDEGTGRSFKTVELIVEEITDPARSDPVRSDPTQADPPAASRIVGLRVGWHELEIRKAVKGAWGRWNPQERVWELQHDRIIDLGLEERIVGP